MVCRVLFAFLYTVVSRKLMDFFGVSVSMVNAMPSSKLLTKLRSWGADSSLTTRNRSSTYREIKNGLRCEELI